MDTNYFLEKYDMPPTDATEICHIMRADIFYLLGVISGMRETVKIMKDGVFWK